MAITNTTLFSETWNEIYALINTASITGVQKITSAYIDDSVLLPQIVINSPDVGENEYSFDRTNSSKDIVVIVDVYTKKTIDMDNIMDAVFSLDYNSISGLQLNEKIVTTAHSQPSNQNVHLKSLNLRFKRR